MKSMLTKEGKRFVLDYVGQFETGKAKTLCVQLCVGLRKDTGNAYFIGGL